MATGAGAPQTSATANDALVELHDPHAPIARPLRITADDAPEAVPILPKSVGHPQPPPGSQLATAAKAQTLAARAYDILRTNCKECHCQPKPYKRIEILNYSALLKAGKIVPGKPDESLIYEVISGNQPSMPKGGTLDIAEVDVIRDWIAAGAPPFPTTPAPPAPERRH